MFRYKFFSAFEILFKPLHILNQKNYFYKTTTDDEPFSVQHRKYESFLLA